MPAKSKGFKETINDLRCLLDDPTKKMSVQLNLATFFVGLGIMMVGVMGTVHPPAVAEVVPNCPVGVTPIIAVCIGFLTSLLSVFGVCGSLTASKLLVCFYGFTFVILGAAVVAMGSCALNYLIKNFDGTHLKEINELMKRYTNDNYKEIDNINRQFECCGLQGYESWPEWGATSPEDMNRTRVMPASCCRGTTSADDTNRKKCTRDHATHIKCPELVVNEKYTMALYSLVASVILIMYYFIVVLCSFFLATAFAY